MHKPNDQSSSVKIFDARTSNILTLLLTSRLGTSIKKYFKTCLILLFFDNSTITKDYNH